MTEKWDTLTKKELLQLLEPYDDEKHIVFKVNLKQGNVGFWDVKKDEINSDTDKLVLMSEALDKWYAEDIKELVEENKHLKLDFKDKVFNLIDAKIKLYSHKPVSASISQPMSVNFDADVDRLARLSELEALKEELQE